MFDLVDNLRAWTPNFMLMFTRLAAMVLTLPVISYPVISPRIRIFIALGLTLLLFPMFTPTTPVPGSLGGLVLAVGREALVGLTIGFGTKMIFESLHMAGSFVGRQMGLEMAQVMDPTTLHQVPMLSQFWLLVVIMMFLAVDGHHLLIGVVVRSFNLIPVGGGFFPPALGRSIVNGGSMTFSLALRFAAPVMTLLLLVDTAIALVARVMPQMNVFFVTLPLKIGAGLFGLVISLDIFQLFFDMFYSDLISFVETNITHLAAG